MESECYEESCHVVSAPGYWARYGRTWPNPACKIIGIAQAVANSYNNYLYGVIAISTYLRVVRGYSFSFGRYDYRLFLIITTFMLATTLPSIDNGFGPQKYWCATNDHQAKEYIIGMISMIGITLITLFCFVCILRLLAQNRNQMSIESDGTQISENLEYVVTRKIASYVLSCSINFFKIPVMTYVIALACRATGTWIWVTVIIGINFGGIGNSITYLLNEILLSTKKRKFGTSRIEIKEIES
ncbi:hypothetical protein G9A89_005399 [Geosiphon pyriformis]|nr:hypothetical protein G9A89_005399 [Geosiphon pyriformis]